MHQETNRKSQIEFSVARLKDQRVCKDAIWSAAAHFERAATHVLTARGNRARRRLGWQDKRPWNNQRTAPKPVCKTPVKKIHASVSRQKRCRALFPLAVRTLVAASFKRATALHIGTTDDADERGLYEHGFRTFCALSVSLCEICGSSLPPSNSVHAYSLWISPVGECEISKWRKNQAEMGQKAFTDQGFERGRFGGCRFRLEGKVGYPADF